MSEGMTPPPNWRTVSLPIDLYEEIRKGAEAEYRSVPKETERLLRKALTAEARKA